MSKLKNESQTIKNVYDVVEALGILKEKLSSNYIINSLSANDYRSDFVNFSGKRKSDNSSIDLGNYDRGDKELVIFVESIAGDNKMSKLRQTLERCKSSHESISKLLIQANEGLPPELDRALRLLSNDKKKSLMDAFYRHANVDLNNIKANQITNVRQKGKGFWTILIYPNKNGWSIYKPDGFEISSILYTSFTKVLADGGVAFNIDIQNSASTKDIQDKRKAAKQGSDLDWNSPLFRDRERVNSKFIDKYIDKSGYINHIEKLIEKTALKTLQKDSIYFVQLIDKAEDRMQDTYRKLRAYAVKLPNKDNALSWIDSYARPKQISEYLRYFIQLKDSIEENTIKKNYQQSKNNDIMTYEEYKAKYLEHAAKRYRTYYGYVQEALLNYAENIENLIDKMPDLKQALK